MQTKKITLSAVLTALALVLGLLERYIPLPIPGMKLGLANIVTLFALYTLGLPYAAGILFLRCILGSIYSGSITALLYSVSGGILSLAVMALARKSSRLSIYGVSALGSAAHSIGQILAAAAVLSSSLIFSYLPVMLIVSAGTGMLVAAAASAVLRILSPNDA